MKLRLNFLVFLIGSSLISCVSEPVNNEDLAISSPVKAELLLPENEKPCEIGEVFGTKAMVQFRWIRGDNTEEFHLSVTNVETKRETKRTGLKNSRIELPLDRGHNYQWKVLSLNEGTIITESDLFSFYLAEDAGEENNAPNKAEAIFPTPGSTVESSETGTVILEWQATDPDDDNLTFSLLIDTVDGKQAPTEENTDLNTTFKEVGVNPGVVYYWSIITSDGKSAVQSDVFSFRVD